MIIIKETSYYKRSTEFLTEKKVPSVTSTSYKTVEEIGDPLDKKEVQRMIDNGIQVSNIGNKIYLVSNE